MSSVFECKLCGALLLGHGVSNHMKSHGLSADYYILRKKPEPHFVIDVEPDKGRYRKGQKIAKWVFEVGGQYKTRLLRGDCKKYRLWVTGRIRYVNNKYHKKLRYPSYLEDYEGLFNSSSSSL